MKGRLEVVVKEARKRVGKISNNRVEEESGDGGVEEKQKKTKIIEKLNCADCKKKFFDVAALEYHRIHQHAIEITPVRKFEKAPSLSKSEVRNSSKISESSSGDEGGVSQTGKKRKMEENNDVKVKSR